MKNKYQKFLLLSAALLFTLQSWGQTWNLSTTMKATLDNKGCLTISTTKAGGEEMRDYYFTDQMDHLAPWFPNAHKNIYSVVIQDKVTTIGGAVFYDCSNLSSVTIPNSVTSIGNAAFAICSSLNSIAIPNSVNIIGDVAFQYCLNLTSITIPNSVKTIGGMAFEGCSKLASVVMPNSVTSIGNAAFAACSALTNVTVSWATPLSVSSYLFTGVNLSAATLHVPAGTKALYQAAPVWKDFGTIVEGSPQTPNYEISLSSIDGKRTPIGVAADGEAQIEIQVKKINNNAPNVSNIDYRLVNTSGQTGKLSGGQSNTGGYYSIIYTAPIYFDETRSYKVQQVEAKITYANSSTETLYHNIMILRPPVLLVHGLNSNPDDAFNKLYRKLTDGILYNYYQVLNVDYSETHNDSFETNKNVVRDNIRKLISNVILKGYEVNKADIVAHSMGGILSRLYLQSNDYRYDINRLITLNTPHSGSQAANLLVFGYTLPDQVNKNKYNNGDAIKDLCVDSEAIAKLNGVNRNKNIVPSHAIVTDYKDYYNPLQILKIDEALVYWSIVFYKEEGNDIFMNRPNDLVVEVMSQEGGIGYKYTSFFGRIWHTESTNNDNVIDEVIGLLNTSPDNSNVFSMDGYNPPKLSTLHPSKSVITPIIRSSTQDEIQIVNIDKTECRNDETIKIHIKGSNSISIMSLLIPVDNDRFYVATKDGNDNEFSYTVPSSSMGEYDVYAVGFTNNREIVIDSAKINILNNSDLVAIETYTGDLILHVGESYTIPIKGLYSDDVYRNTGYLDGMTFSSVNDNISFKAPNILVGEKIGLDTLIISYKDMIATRPIEVITNDDDVTSNEAISHKLVNNSLDVLIYPNPTSTEFILNINNLNHEIYRVSLYNIYGQMLQEKTINGGKTTFNVSKYPTGMYLVRISDGSGKSVTKKLIKE